VSKKKLPLFYPFGSIKLDSWIVYDSDSQSVITSDNKCTMCKGNDKPRMFIDLEMIEDVESKAYRGLQVHLALSGLKVHKEKARRKLKRTRVDVYLQKNQALELYKILRQMLRELGHPT